MNTKINMSASSENFLRMIEKKEWDKIRTLIQPNFFRRAGWSERICEQLIYIALARGIPFELLVAMAEGRTIVKNANVYVFLASRYKWTDQYYLLEFLQHSDILVDALIKKTATNQAYFRSPEAQEMLVKFRRTKTTWRIIWIKERSGLRVPFTLIREIAEYW